MAQVHLSIATETDDDWAGVGALALAEVSRVGTSSGPLGVRVRTGLELPFSESDATAIELELGRYLVSVNLPNGKMLQEAITVHAHGPLRFVLKSRSQLSRAATRLPAKTLGGKKESGGTPERGQPDVSASKAAISRGAADEQKGHPRGLVEGSFGRRSEASNDQIGSSNASATFSQPFQAPSEPSRPFRPRLKVGAIRRDPRTLSRYREKASPLPSDQPRILIDLPPRSWRWRSPLVKDFAFVDQEGWLSELRQAALEDRVLTNLYDLPHERMLLREVNDPGIEPRYDGIKRIFGQRYVVAFENLATAGSFSLAVVPTRWRPTDQRTVADHDRAAEVMQVRARETEIWQLKVGPADARFAALLGYLTIGDVSSARHLVKDSLEYLMAKASNPFAAAAGGLMLMYSDENEIEHQHWPEWIQNLARWFPSLPDAQILLATLYLQRRRLADRIGGEFSDELQRLKFVRRLLERSMRAGLPMYSLSMRLLVENLEILLSEEGRLNYSRVDPEMSTKRALECVRLWSARVATVQPFTVLEFD